LLAGVGGQGTILVSRILTHALIKAGFDVKMSEIHGMAQRGGSVSTTVRYGNQVQSPLVGKGAADVLVSFELMEAVRWSAWLKPDGVIVVNDYKIRPLPVASGAAEYPDHYLAALGEQFRVVSFNAGEEAKNLGNARVMNVIMLGAMVEAFKMDAFDWDGALKEHVPPKFLEINRKAFETGRALARQPS
ncbi:MAG TPA: indolepyruvate oxidoreductase subunit beta, partial [Clostridia bacterium]|nr:indolepyruvate oxidoreductase subunit beta [Clostridia bacterium]